MENRNLILAMALSMIVILGWSFLSEELGLTPPKPEISATENSGQATQPAAPAPAANVPAAQPVSAPAQGKDLVIETPLYKAVLYTGGGFLRSFELKHYKTSIDPSAALVNIISPEAAKSAPMGLLLNGISSWTAGNWQLEEGGDLTLAPGTKGSVRLTGEIENMRISRLFIFNADTYTVEEKLEIASPVQRSVSLGLKVNATSLRNADEDRNITRIAELLGGSFKETESESDLKEGISASGDLGWGAIMSNYFIAAICPESNDFSLKGLLRDNVFSLVMEKSGIAVEPGAPSPLNATYYFGPKKTSDLEKGPKDLFKALDYGMFTIVARPLIFLLKVFYQFVGNYGVAIILLTIVIKAILWPLSQKSYKSMNQMKKLQPLMAKLRDKYKDDKTELNKQMMQLYKTYKVNPMSGCLPILVQLPVFVGLYQGLLNAIELRQSSFITYLPFTDKIWLADLSVMDPYFITPLIMGATMLLMQKMTPNPGDPTQAKILMLMPVVFTAMFITFPSGLVVYWLTNNVLSIAQQWWMLRNKD